MAISFVVHAGKAMARPVINVSTAGFGSPVVSTIEDAFSFAMSFFAILFPFVVIIFLISLVWAFVAVRRRRRRRKL